MAINDDNPLDFSSFGTPVDDGATPFDNFATPQPAAAKPRSTYGFNPDIETAIDDAAGTHGVDPDLMRTFARIESGGDPRKRTGSYNGLFMLSADEFKRFGGDADIFDPAANARAAALKFKSEEADFEKNYGRKPSASELYFLHQQGVGGADAHWRNPEAPAWENMYRTAEGRQKGPAWAKQAIWGNLPDSEKRRFGSVENITSRDFTDFWDRRVRDLSGQNKPVQVAQAPRQTMTDALDFSQFGTPVSEKPLDFTKQAVKPESDDRWEISKGFVGGFIGGNPKNFGDALVGFGHVFERPELLTRGDDIAKWGKDKLENYKARIPSFTDIRTDGVLNFLSDLGSYAGYQTGQAVASSLPSLATGAILGGTLKNPTAARVGWWAGASVPSFIQNYGDVYGSVREDEGIQKRIKAGEITEREAATWSMMAGGAMAALDTWGLEKVLGGAFKEAKADLKRRILAGMVKGAATEGPTEAMQEVISQWAQYWLGSEKTLKQAAIEVVDNFFGGVFGGGAIGGATSAIQRPAAKAEPAPDGGRVELDAAKGKVNPTAPRTTPPPLPEEGPEMSLPDVPGKPATETPPPSPEEMSVLRRMGYTEVDIRDMEPEQRFAEMEDAKSRGIVPDVPSAEPIQDIVAQARDLADPENDRRGLYLSPDNVRQIQENPDFIEQIGAALRNQGELVQNIDGNGGILLTKDAATADAVRTAIQGGQDLQQVLGEVTGAGQGKPADATAVVQQVTPEGAVTRESAVTEDQVAPTLDAFKADGRDVRAVTPEEAIARREQGRATPPPLPTEQVGDGSRQAPVRVETPEDIARAEQRVAEPTDGQKDAGNYSKGHLKFQGLDITIENPKGSIRRGTSPDGTPWEVVMPTTYGYLKRSVGRDGDQVDVYVGPNPKSDRVFIIDQVDPDTGKFDEHKAMIGYNTISAARFDYEQAFSDGRAAERMGGVTEMTVAKFKDWLAKGKRTRPLSKLDEKPDTVAEQPTETTQEQADKLPDNLTDAERETLVKAWRYVNAIEQARAQGRDIQQQRLDIANELDADLASYGIEFDSFPDERSLREYLGGSRGTDQAGNAVVEAPQAAEAEAPVAEGSGRAGSPQAEVVQRGQADRGREGDGAGQRAAEVERPKRYEGDTLTDDDIDTIVDQWKYVREVANRPKPESLAAFVIARGGIKDDAREVRHIAGAAKERPGLINKDGWALDDIALASWEAGFMGDMAERPTIADFLDRLQDDLHTGTVVRLNDEPLLDDIRIANEIARELADYGVTTNRFRSEATLREYFGQERPAVAGKAARDEEAEPAAEERTGQARPDQDEVILPPDEAPETGPSDSRPMSRDAFIEALTAGVNDRGNEVIAPNGTTYRIDFKPSRGTYVVVSKEPESNGIAFTKGPGGPGEKWSRPYAAEIAADEAGLTKETGITTEASGQTSLVPEATTKEKIAAEAKKKGDRGKANADLDAGELFNPDAGKQTDLVDMAKAEPKKSDPFKGEMPETPDWDFIPNANWRDHLMRARVYATALRIDHRGMSLEEIVKAIDDAMTEFARVPDGVKVWMSDYTLDAEEARINGGEYHAYASDKKGTVDGYGDGPRQAIADAVARLKRRREDEAPKARKDKQAEEQDQAQDRGNEGGQVEPLTAIADELRAGGFKTILEARKFAKDLGIEGDNKAIDEMIERAVVQAARQIVADGKAPQGTFKALVDLYGNQPNLASRTGTSVANQAYSTPMPLAYLASRLAGVASVDTVYEPTAGNGALLIEANPVEQTVHANELDPRRAEALKAQGFEPTTNDGSAVPRLKDIDSVIMNPPFGAVKAGGKSTVFKAGDWSTTQIDHAVALNGLEAMASDGKAVLILGGTKSEDVKERRKDYRGKAKREFYYRLYNQYNVVDHFTVSGDLYSKQGASWPVDVIVIDGRGKSARKLPAADPPAILKSWDEIGAKLDGRYDKVETQQGQRPADAIAELGATEKPAAADAGTGETAQGGRPDGTLSRPEGDRGGVRPDDNRRQPGDVRAPSGKPAAEPQRGERGGTGERADVEPVRPRVKRERQEGASQAAYEPASNAKALDTLIPVNMADAARNAIERVAERHGSVDKYVAEKLGYRPGSNEFAKAFSAEQVDALAAAIDNIERGSAMIVGDQTGIGKGRVAAGVLRYAMRQGLTPVFVTEKPDLYGDIYRDLRDIGVPDMLEREPRLFMTNSGSDSTVALDEAAVEWKDEANEARANGEKTPKRRGKWLTGGTAPKVANGMAQIAAGEDIADIILTTYDQMNTVKGQTTARRRFLSEIAPGAIFVMDESHNAGGTAKTGWEKKDATPNRADFARELAAKAKGVLFSSATYAKRPDVMDLYARTDMGKAVDDAKELPELIQRGGVPMQQIVASMLSESGQYLRRERSFDGVEYALKPVEVSQKAYRQFSSSMREIFRFDLAVEEFRDNYGQDILDEMGYGQARDSGVGQGSAHTTSFSSLMHNITSQMLLAIKADVTADEAILAHRNKEKPIIALANTNEAFIRDFAEAEGIKVGEALDLDFGAVLMRYLSRTLRITVKGPEGEKPTHVQIPVNKLPPSLQNAYKAAEKAIRDGDYQSLPISPIDWIRHRLTEAGMSVREITGRQGAIDYSTPTPKYAKRPKNEIGPAGKQSTKLAFNSGRLDAIILNRSGSTGISLHAGETFKDQRRRRMILAQAEANIDIHLQMLGRIHRTGQVTLPAYSQIAANIPAEARPTAILMKKMASLNANTTGARSSAFTVDSVDFMNEVGDKVVADVLQEDPDLNVDLGSPLMFDERGNPNIEDVSRKATGRLTLLDVDVQEMLLDRIQTAYKSEIAQLDALGENPLEAKTIDLKAKVIDTTELKPKQGEGPFLDAVKIEKISAKAEGRAMPPTEVAAKVAESIKGTKPDTAIPAALASLETQGRMWADKERGRVTGLMREQIRTEVAETGPDAKESTRRRLEAQLERWNATMTIAHPGARVVLGMPAGDLNGIVMSVERTGKAKQMTALGSWTVKIAVPDSMRVLEFPMSKLFPPSAPKSEDEKGATIARAGISHADLVEQFEAARKEGRETRYVVTGNILGGYDQTRGRGRIVNFTTDDGKIRPGILMGREFEVDKFMDNRRVRFQTGAQIATFLDRVPLTEVTSKAGEITLAVYRGEYRIEMAGSRQKAGQFFTDRDVLKALAPKDFAKRGNKMVVDGLSRAQFVRAVDKLKDIGGAFETNNNQDEAQEIITGKKPGALTQEANKTSPPSTKSKAVNDFAKSVDDLKNRLGVQTRPLNRGDDDFSVRSLADDGNGRELTKLSDRIKAMTKGSRVQVVAEHAATFVAEAESIFGVAGQQTDIDPNDLSISDLTTLATALFDLKQIIDQKVQSGYALAEDVQVIRDLLSDRMDELSSRFDEIASDAETIRDDLNSKWDEIQERIEEIDEESGRDTSIEDETGTEVAAPSEQISAYATPAEYEAINNKTDVFLAEEAHGGTFVVSLQQRAEALIETDISELSREELIAAQARVAQTITTSVSLMDWMKVLTEKASEASTEVFDVVNEIGDGQITPAVDRLESIQSDIDDSLEAALDAKEIGEGKIIEIDDEQYGPSRVRGLIASWEGWMRESGPADLEAAIARNPSSMTPEVVAKRKKNIARVESDLAQFKEALAKYEAAASARSVGDLPRPKVSRLDYVKGRLLLRQPVDLSEDARPIFDMMRSEPSVLPGMIPEAVITKLTPKKGTDKYIVTARDQYGEEYTFEDDAKKITRTQGQYLVANGRPLVVLTPLDFGGDFVQTVRTVRAHEAVHALRIAGFLPGGIRDAGTTWGRLVGHADLLGVLHMSRADFYKRLGDPRAATASKDVSTFEVYTTLYGHLNTGLALELYHQEAVAHMMEVYVAGGWTNQEIAPVKAILDDILSGKTAQWTDVREMPLSAGMLRSTADNEDGALGSDRVYSLQDTITGQSMRRDLDNLGFYSKALEAAKSLKQEKGTPEQMLAQLKKAGVKDAEIEATGLGKLLASKTRQSAQHPEGTRMRDVSVSDSYKGENFGQKVLERSGRPIVVADVSITRDEVNVRNIESVERRRGAATALVDDLFREFPDRKITISDMTDDGSKFFRSKYDLGKDGEIRRKTQPITKSEIVKYLEENRVGLREVVNDRGPVLGGDGQWRGTFENTNWSRHSLDPSNPTYRETVIHMDPEQSPDYLRINREIRGLEKRRLGDEVSPGVTVDDRLGQLYSQLGEIKNNSFQSGHFPEPNIIGHMMTSMTRHQGKPVYTIDQIQSDWGQKLRDGGVRDEAKIEELRQKRDAAREAVDAYLMGEPLDFLRRTVPHYPEKTNPGEVSANLGSIARGRVIGDPRAKLTIKVREEAATLYESSAQKAYELLDAELRTAEASSPGHPLVNTTDQWTQTTLRRAIRQAAEAGAEYIAIPHGDTVLSYNPGDTNGMRGFYGSRSSEGIVPKNLRKLIGAPGTRVEKLETSKGLRGWQEEGHRVIGGFDKSQTGFTLFPLTEKVRTSVLEDGQPMFSMVPSVGLSPAPADVAKAEIAKALANVANDEANVQYRSGTLQVAGFVGDWVVPSEGQSVTATSLYEAYSEWVEALKGEPVPLPTFTSALNDLGLAKQKIAGRVRYIGFKVLPDGERPTPRRPMVDPVPASSINQANAQAIYDATSGGRGVLSAVRGLIARLISLVRTNRDPVAIERLVQARALERAVANENDPNGKVIKNVISMFSAVPSKTAPPADTRNISRDITEAISIITRITGKDAVQIEFRDQISGLEANPAQLAASRAAGFDTRTAGGLYKRPTLDAKALIALATNDPAYDLRTAAGHEAFHHVEEVLANPAEKRLLTSDSEMARMRALASDEIMGTPKTVLDHLHRRLTGDGMLMAPSQIADPIERLKYEKEIRAVAFQRYRRMREEGLANASRLHIGIRRLFDRIIQIFQGVRNVLKGYGYDSYEAIFDRARTGEMADPVARRASDRPVRTLRNLIDPQMRPEGYVEREPFDLKNVRLVGRAMASVPLDAIRTIQKSVSIASVRAKLGLPESDDGRPVSVFKYGNTYYVNDGNHRIEAMRINGAKTIRAEIIEIASKDGDVEVLADRGPADVQAQPVGAQEDNQGAQAGLADSDVQASLIPAAARAYTVRWLRRLQPSTDAIRVYLQDKVLPIRRQEEAIEAASGIKLPEHLSVYTAEAIYHGRAGERLTDLQEKYVEPLTQHLRKSNISFDELGDYLYARHALERNEAIRQIDPTNDAGSGMTDAEANGIVGMIEQGSRAQGFKTAAGMIDAMIKDARDTLYRAGNLTKEQYDNWTTKYKSYVPLRGFEGEVEEFGIPRVGRGMDIRGPESMQALGRRSKADNPAAYVIQQSVQAIIRSEKNRVDKTLYRLIQAHPDPDVWRVFKGEARRGINQQTGLVETYWVAPPFAANGKNKDNIFGVKIAGKQHYMWLEDGLARSFRTAQPGLMGTSIGRAFYSLSRFYAQLVTSFNPEFVISNYLRDIQTALMNVGDVANAPPDVRKRIRNEALSFKSIRGVMAALQSHEGRTIFGGQRAADENMLGRKRSKEAQDYAKWFEEYRLAGGKISFIEMNDIDRIKNRVEKSIAEGKTRRALRNVFDLIDNANSAVENGVRLSAYIALRKNGVSQDKAAFAARELTVNFNRKGELGPGINAFYLFFNASVQGTTRLAQALTRSPAVRKGAATIILAGVLIDLLNYSIAGNDDDDENAYEKIDDWKKEKNMIVMLPGRKDYVQIPMPYGYNVLYLFGQKMAALARTAAGAGKEKPEKAIAGLLGAMVESFSPMGAAPSWLQMASPTLLDPFTQIAENKSWFGGKIAPEKLPTQKHKPDSEMFFSTAPAWAIDLARTLNKLSGGSTVKSGPIDISPESIEHIAEFLMGGVGKFIGNIWNTGQRAYNDQEWIPEKTPFLRRVYGKATSESRRRDFYEKWNEVDAAHYQFETYRKAKDFEGMKRVREESPAEIAAYEAMRNAQRQVSALRKQGDAINLNRDIDAVQKEKRLKLLIERENEIILRALKTYSRLKKEKTPQN